MYLTVAVTWVKKSGFRFQIIDNGAESVGVLKCMREIKVLKGLCFIFTRLRMSKLRISSMLLNVENSFYSIVPFIL